MWPLAPTATPVGLKSSLDIVKGLSPAQAAGRHRAGPVRDVNDDGTNRRRIDRVGRVYNVEVASSRSRTDSRRYRPGPSSSPFPGSANVVSDRLLTPASDGESAHSEPSGAAATRSAEPGSFEKLSEPIDCGPTLRGASGIALAGSSPESGIGATLNEAGDSDCG